MVTIKIKQNSKQAKLFLEYVKTLSFVEVLNTSGTSSNKKEKLLSDIEKGLQEVKSIREGKTKPLSTSDLWNE
ncbi:hypothetical protein SAMN05444395_103112 [Flavobacterium fryxellicola]|nr:hypothetical protein [Flavobacterium fryxellicola]SHN64388.1 hypothetical protein SAMN05444395_103112 [Flavobacterium fryxellicola]